MRLVLKIMAAMVLILGLLIALNYTKINRLMTVNTLFDADKIVENFSSMDAAFLHHDLKIGTLEPWPENIQELPDTVMIAGQERALTDILSELDTTALVIIKDGELIHESYYKGTDREDLRISWSVAKSFMSGLYGHALESGQIESLDDPADKYVPSLKGSAYEGVSLANILNMSSGVVFNEDYMDPKSDINDMGRVLGLGGSMDKYAATLTETYYEPGTNWQYVSIDTHVAAMALRAATGKTLHELFEETYGAKLGFQEGKWKGEQIIPADWVRNSTTNHAPVFHPERGTGYGYQWWVPMPQDGPHKGDFFAVGIYGQYVYVNPRHNIVIAKNAAHRTFTEAGKSGQTSIEDNVDMFRSLAEQMSVYEEQRIDVDSIIGFEPISFEELKNDNSFFGCGCTFEKDGDWLFSSLHDEIGYYKSNGKMTKLPSIKSSGEFFYGTRSYGDEEITVEFSIEEESEKKVGNETLIYDGSINVTRDLHSFKLSGKVSCGC